MAPLSIGFDWDDVMISWYDRAVELCRIAGVCPADVTPSSWSMHEEMGCTLEEWVAVLDAATVSGELYDTVPYPEALEAMRRLYWEGHYIHIVTARGTFHGNQHNERIHEITRAQVEEFAVPHHSLTFTRDKTVVPTDYFIDDNVRNVKNLLDAGVEAYVLTRPWNLDADLPHRVASVEEFANIILTKESL